MASFQKNASGNFEYVPTTKRTAGFEGVSAAAFDGPDLNLDGNGLGLDGAAEASLSGAVIAAAYSGLMKFLELEVLVKAGGLSRREQLMAAKDAAWQYSKSKAVYIILIASVLAFLPGIAPLAAVAGVLGGSAMAYKLVRQFYAALDPSQLAELRESAANAGIDLKGMPEAPAPNQPQTAAAAA